MNEKNRKMVFAGVEGAAVMGYILEEKTIYIYCANGHWIKGKLLLQMLKNLEMYIGECRTICCDDNILDSEKGINLSNSSISICQPLDYDVQYSYLDNVQQPISHTIK